MTDEIPEDVKQLLVEHVESYEQLELLLFLARHRGEPHTATDIARAIGVSTDSAVEALDHLRRRGLVAEISTAAESEFRFAPRSARSDAAVETLARLYQERRVEVVKLMTDNAIARVRTAAIRTFADAFIVKKRGEDDG